MRFPKILNYQGSNSIGVVSFADSLVGYIGPVKPMLTFAPKKGIWFRTTNGGQSWDTLHFPESIFEGDFSGPMPEWITTPSPSTVYMEMINANGDMVTISSYDTGRTWLRRDYAKRYLSYKSMITPRIGLQFAQGNNTLFMTKDSCWNFYGVEYTEAFDSVYNPGLIGFNYSPVDWSDTNHFIVDLPAVKAFSWLTTTDGGNSWKHHTEKINQLRPYHFYGEMRFLKGTPYVWMRTRDNYLQDTTRISFMYSSDYGESWKRDTSFFGKLVTLCPVGPTSFWTAINEIPSPTSPINDSWLLFTSNNGKTWYIDSTTARSMRIRSIQFPDPEHGYILAAENDTVVTILKYSTDGDLAVTAKKRTLPSSFTISPNPSNNQITIHANGLKESTLFRIYNILGQEVKRDRIEPSENKQLTLTDLQPGVYTCIINDHSERFILMR